jgi:adenylate kinase
MSSTNERAGIPVISGVRMVMLGRQGAGKGTQCGRLARHYVVPHISTGDMLRTAVKQGTELGRRAKEIMDAGDLVSDEIIVGVVDERLHQGGTTRRGYVLDGFPRTVAQAEALADITAAQPLHVVVDLEVPTEVVVDRIASRRTCADCGAIYSTVVPPKYGWHCDNCGGEVIQRDDDTEEAILHRLDLYERETAPLVAWYADRKLAVEVDGIGTADEVSARIIAVVDERVGAASTPG